MTTRVIGDNGSFVKDVLIRDIVHRSDKGWDRFCEFSGSVGRGTIRDISIDTFQTTVGFEIDGAGWLIKDLTVRCLDSVLILNADQSIVRGIVTAPPNAFQDYTIIINGDDNLIEGCLLSRGIKVVGDRNHIIGNTLRMFDLSFQPTGGPVPIRVEGDDNYIHGNKAIEAASGGGDDTIPIGLEIVSGANRTVVGINDLDAATIPITDAGTGTQYRHHKALSPPFISGTVATATGVARLRIPEDIFIIDAAAMIGTAPTGVALIVDVHLNGTTIFTTQGNRPTIAVSAFDSGLATPDVQVAAAGQYFTVDVDQIGSTVAGSDLTVFIRYVPTGAIG